MKKFIFCLISILLSITAFAHDFEAVNADGKTIYYNKVAGGAEVTYPGNSYNVLAYQGNIVIPETVYYMGEDLPVVGIHEKTFLNSLQITSMHIGDNVSYIGDFALSDCQNITELYIGKSLTTVGSNGLYNLLNLRKAIYNAKNFNGQYIFLGLSNLTELIIGDDVQSLPNSLFAILPIEEITIPANVVSIGNAVISSCSELKKVTFCANVENINGYFISSCPKFDTLIYDVSDFKAEDFPYCFNSVKYLTIGDNVSSLPDSFMYNNTFLTTLNLGNGIKSIGSYAFYRNNLLTEIIIPNSVESIGGGAFSHCDNIQKIVIGENVQNIGAYAFDDLIALTDLQYNAIDCSITEQAFDFDSALTKVNIGASVKQFNQKMFYYAYDLGEFIVDTNNPYLKSIDGVVYSIDEKSIVKFPAGKTGNYDIPSGVNTILDYAFFGHNQNLNSVIIPATTNNIGNGAFQAYYHLTDVYCYALEPPTIGDNAFNNSYRNATLHVPANSVALYKSANEWRKFSKITYVIVQPTNISIPETLEIMHGNTTTITPTFSPDNATETSVIWTSENPEIASVNSYGTIKGESVGQTTITATCGSLSASCLVTVYPQPNRLEAQLISTLTNSNVEYPIDLVCDEKFTSLEFDLTLPKNINLRRDQNYELYITLSNRAKYHDYSITYKNDKYHVSIFSIQRDEFMGNSGHLFSLPLSITGDARNAEILVSSVKATKKDNSVIDFLDLKAPLEITVIPGDANGDNMITIADFTGVIAKSSNTTVRNFVQSAADINEDGTIDLDDAISILDLLLSGDQTLYDMGNTVSEELQEVYSITADNLLSEGILRVNLKNSYSSIRDIQFALTLPNGVYIAQDENGYFDISLNDERANRYRATCKYIDGVYRIAISSSTVRNIMYGDNWIADIKLSWGEPSGSVPFKMHNIHLSAFNNNSEVIDIPVANYEGSITLDSQGGVDDVLNDASISISCSDLTVTISGLHDNEQIAIYNLSGLCVYQGSEHSITLSQHGAYIIKVNNHIAKILL